MKLRIRSDTIRLRLKRSEVQKIAAGERLSDQTRFPNATFGYEVVTADDANFEAVFRDNTMSITLPADAVRHWASSDEVSLYEDQDVGSGEKLSLLVEKDFECLSPGHHRPGEDDEDTYPHPDAGTDRGC